MVGSTTVCELVEYFIDRSFWNSCECVINVSLSNNVYHTSLVYMYFADLFSPTGDQVGIRALACDYLHTMGFRQT